MLPANFQIHLDYSLEQRFMAKFMSESAAHRRERCEGGCIIDIAEIRYFANVRKAL